MTNRNDGTRDTSNEPLDNEESTPAGQALIKRREWLATVGASLATPVLGSGVVRAEDQGYGDGAYGDGPYGDPTDEDEETDEEEEELDVTTLDATDVDESSATLNGELTTLKGHDEAIVYFEWGESGDLSNVTDEQTLDSVGKFDDEVTDLESDVEYDFRAIAEPGDDSETVSNNK